MRLFTYLAAAMLIAAPAFAQGTSDRAPASGSQGAAGNGGNGTTSSSSSGPEMKRGAEKSPTAGAPAGGSAGTAAGASGKN